MRYPPDSLFRGTLAVMALLAAGATHAQSMWENLDGQLGALAPENLEAHGSSAAPADFTGTWGIDLSTWQFPPPEGLKPEYREMLERAQAADEAGRVFNNDVGLCWPPGVPMMMNRVWPINIIQLPTSIVIISNFMNQVRWIYMDGREHTDPNLVVPSWNGESIGSWDGDTLVVETRHFAGEHHWIRDGIPATENLRIVERFSLSEDGEQLEIEYTMTDPEVWEGEWVHTKVYNLEDKVDFTEVHCLPDTNEGIMATDEEYRVTE